MPSLKDQLEAVKASHKSFIDSLNQLIQELPDNPDINRIEGSDNSFTMTFSSLNADTLNLDPRHYDFKYQYKAIAEYICSPDIPIEHSIQRIERVIKEGKVILPRTSANSPYDTVYLHKKVLQHIQSLFNGTSEK